MRRALLAAVLAGGLVAGGASAAEPWPGTLDVGGLDGLTRCASLYQMLDKRARSAEERLVDESLVEAYAAALDADDPASRLEPIPRTPDLSASWRAIILAGVGRYEETLQQMMDTQGGLHVLGFLHVEHTACEALYAARPKLGHPLR